jgi:RNA polymerase sigma-70 factor (ECF subfamily)
MEDDRDRVLIERCRAGEEPAFLELIERYTPVVYALILRMVGERPQAEELAQEVFARVYHGMPYFRGEARLSTWICRIIVDACAEADGVAAVDSKSRGPLEWAMARLPTIDRLLIAAYALEGLRDEDLADALKLPAGSIPTHRHRAMRQLRRLLEPER